MEQAKVEKNTMETMPEWLDAIEQEILAVVRKELADNSETTLPWHTAKGLPRPRLSAHDIGAAWLIRKLGTVEDLRAGYLLFCGRTWEELVSGPASFLVAYDADMVLKYAQEHHIPTGVPSTFTRVGHHALRTAVEKHWVTLPAREREKWISTHFNKVKAKGRVLVAGSLRHTLLDKFETLKAAFKRSTYDGSLPACPERAEFARTTFCALFGREMLHARAAHAQLTQKKRESAAVEERAAKRVAWDKQTAKRNAQRELLGDAAWNARKHRQKAEKEVRKAKEVTGDAKREAEFLEWRRTLYGRKWDTAQTALVSRRIPRGHAVTTTKDLGTTDFPTMARFLDKYLGKAAGTPTIQFKVDRADSTTALFQHVGMTDGGVLPLSNTDDFPTDGRTFNITGYLRHAGCLYINIDSKRISAYRRLPDPWSAFEGWSGHGVVGNPKLSTYYDVLFKVSPTNIGRIELTVGGKRYSVTQTYNQSRCNTLAELESKMTDTLDDAAAAARRAAAADREARAKRARAKAADQKKPIYPSHPDASNYLQDNVARMLTQQLAAGTIDAKTFAAAMKAIRR